MPVQLQQTLARRRPGWLTAVLDDVLSVEACFILFLVAGRYKALPEFQWLPADPTMLFFVVTLGLILHRCASRQLRPMPLDSSDLLMMAFVALGVVSVFWSSMDPKNIDKVWRFVLVSVSGYFFASVLAQDAERRARLVRLMLAFSVLLMAYYTVFRWVVGISQWELETTGRVRGNNYLEYGTHAGFMFLGSLALVVFGPRKWLIPALAGAVMGLFLLTLIGARGALVFSVAGVPLAGAALLFNRQRFGVGAKRLAMLIGVLVVMAWAGYAALVAVKGFSEASEQLYTLERLTNQLTSESTSSLDLRAEGRELAFRRWLEQPILGWGLGEFRVQHSVDYPHNLLLECLMEVGLTGTVLFLLPHLAALFACLRTLRDPAAGWADMAIAIEFVTSFVSHMTVEGYLGDNRVYFAALGMAICLGRRPKRRVVIQPAVRSPAEPQPKSLAAKRLGKAA